MIADAAGRRIPGQPDPDDRAAYDHRIVRLRPCRESDRMAGVAALRQDVRSSLHRMILGAAELRHIVRLIRAIRGCARISHLSCADDAKIIIWLLPPDHLRDKWPAIRQAGVLDLRFINDLIFGECKHRRDRISLDGAVIVGRQHGP